MRLLPVLAILLATPALAEDFIIVQSTTSTANSGLYDAILPTYAKTGGPEVRVVAVGTGQALRNARNCDGDLLLVHARSAEEAFVAEGFGTDRKDLMYNDFVLVGPEGDPAGAGQGEDISAALLAIIETHTPFASRGDDSGTHKKERALWERAGLDTSAGEGGWYRETGSGMGATLNLAAGMGAYTLTDRATWLSFANRDGMAILSEGDPALFNQYGIVLVNPERCPSVKEDAARNFRDWMISPEGQSAIAAHERNGEQLFFPNAD